jgi:hypothetical protein
MNNNTPNLTQDLMNELQMLREQKEKKRAYDRRYKEANREKLKAKNKEYNSTRYIEKYTCECGEYISIKRKEKHELTQKHKDFINGKEYDYLCECGKRMSRYWIPRHENSKQHQDYLKTKI